jgi:predicted nucleic acid-binding protein
MTAPSLATCVLDASAVVRLITGDPEASQWAQHIERAPLVLAPELMLSEVANTLWKLHRAGHLSAQDPQELLADARDLVDQIEPDRHLQVEALALACHLDHPVYDCLYLALARREAALLLTADQRLQKLASRVLP